MVIYAEKGSLKLKNIINNTLIWNTGRHVLLSGWIQTLSGRTVTHQVKGLPTNHVILLNPSIILNKKMQDNILSKQHNNT